MVKDVLAKRQKGALISAEYFARRTWCVKNKLRKNAENNNNGSHLMIK